MERTELILLPPLRSATTETRAVMAELALANCLAVLAGQPPKTPIPLPAV